MTDEAKEEAESERLRRPRIATRATGPALDEFSDIPEFDPRGLTVEQFRERLNQVRWFSRLGQPHPRDQLVDRIAAWDEWGGPESRCASPMGPERGSEPLVQLGPGGRLRLQYGRLEEGGDQPAEG